MDATEVWAWLVLSSWVKNFWCRLLPWATKKNTLIINAALLSVMLQRSQIKNTYKVTYQSTRRRVRSSCSSRMVMDITHAGCCAANVLPKNWTESTFFINKLCQNPENVPQLGYFCHIKHYGRKERLTLLVRAAEPTPWSGFLPRLDSCAILCQQSKPLLLKENYWYDHYNDPAKSMQFGFNNSIDLTRSRRIRVCSCDQVIWVVPWRNTNTSVS